MKLDHDCVRHLLLFVEESLDYGDEIDTHSISIDNYTPEEITYTAEKLIEAGYLNGEPINFLGSDIPDILISSLTFNGHEFLDNIRDDKVWKKTKEVLSSHASSSLKIVNSTAIQVVTTLAGQAFKNYIS